MTTKDILNQMEKEFNRRVWTNKMDLYPSVRTLLESFGEEILGEDEEIFYGQDWFKGHVMFGSIANPVFVVQTYAQKIVEYRNRDNTVRKKAPLQYLSEILDSGMEVNNWIMVNHELHKHFGDFETKVYSTPVFKWSDFAIDIEGNRGAVRNQEAVIRNEIRAEQRLKVKEIISSIGK